MGRSEPGLAFLWPGLNPTPSQHPKLDVFSGLVGRECPALLREPSPCTAVLVQVFCILPFELAGFGSELRLLPVCFCFLQWFLKQGGWSVLGMDVAAPTPSCHFS